MLFEHTREQPSTRPAAASMRGLLHVIWRLVQVGIALYGLGTIGYLAVRYSVDERPTPIAFADNFLPWWAMGGLALAIVALFGRGRWLLVALQVPIIVMGVRQYGEMFLPQDTPSAAGLPVKVMTFNIYSDESDPAGVVDLIREQDADIVGLQELGVAHADRIERELAAEYPYRLLYGTPTNHGVGLLSRYPIVDEYVYYEFFKYVRNLRVGLDVNGQRVNVYIAHPHSPRNPAHPLSYDTGLRDDQLEALRELLVEETNPALVVCDCNMSDQSKLYGQIKHVMVDSFREAGWGFGFTFPTKMLGRGIAAPRLLRIDYVWHSSHFVAQDAYVVNKSAGSDHRPVVAELVFKDADGATTGTE